MSLFVAAGLVGVEPGLLPDGFASAESVIVDGEDGGVDLEAVGRGVEDNGLLGLGGVGVVVLVHVDHLGGEEGLPVANGEEELLVEDRGGGTGVGGGLDVDE